MAVDTFIYIDGIKGESTDSTHKDWIEVLSHSAPMTQPAPGAVASASASGRAEFHDFSIVKLMDKSSPKLYEAASTGKHIKKVIIEMIRASGDRPVKYMTIEMHQVTISQVSSTARSGTSPVRQPAPVTLAVATTPALLRENVSFNYGSIKWTYTQQKRPDGSTGGNTAAKWNMTQQSA